MKVYLKSCVMINFQGQLHLSCSNIPVNEKNSSASIKKIGATPPHKY